MMPRTGSGGLGRGRRLLLGQLEDHDRRFARPQPGIRIRVGRGPQSTLINQAGSRGDGRSSSAVIRWLLCVYTVNVMDSLGLHRKLVKMSEAAAPYAARAPLTRERVIEAAVELADRGGIESLSMRKLGQELGVEGMALYRHVRAKDAILDGVIA